MNINEVVNDLNSYDFSKVDSNVKMVFIETPSNPLLEVTDIKRVAEKKKKKGILVVADNTFMTAYLQKNLDLGADLVVYSATKYYGGHSDLLAGLVVLNDEEILKVINTDINNKYTLDSLSQLIDVQMNLSDKIRELFK